MPPLDIKLDQMKHSFRYLQDFFPKLSAAKSQSRRLNWTTDKEIPHEACQDGESSSGLPKPESMLSLLSEEGWQIVVQDEQGEHYSEKMITLGVAM